MMQAKQAFSCSLDRDGLVPYAVGPGDVFPATDEIVRRFPDMFRPLLVRDSSVIRRPLASYPGAAETATAAPGERRSMARATPPRSKAGAGAAPPPTPAAAPAATSTSEV